MRKRLKSFMKNKIWGSAKEPLPLRKQLSRMITICCVTAVCIQAVVMVAMTINQYVTREREDILYILESDNIKIDNIFQYVEENIIMNIKEFWKGKELGDNHKEAVLGMEFEEQECKRLYRLYEENHNEFFEDVLKKEDSGLWFLWLYSNMACKVYERYMEAGIPEQIFRDTFRDIQGRCVLRKVHK